jgi:hypothetical protein
VLEGFSFCPKNVFLSMNTPAISGIPSNLNDCETQVLAVWRKANLNPSIQEFLAKALEHPLTKA